MGPKGAARQVAAVGATPGAGLTTKQSERALRRPHAWRKAASLRAARKASERANSHRSVEKLRGRRSVGVITLRVGGCGNPQWGQRSLKPEPLRSTPSDSDPVPCSVCLRMAVANDMRTRELNPPIHQRAGEVTSGVLQSRGNWNIIRA